MPKLCIVTIGDGRASRIIQNCTMDQLFARRATGASSVLSAPTAQAARDRLAQLPQNQFDEIGFIGHGIVARTGGTFFAFSSPIGITLGVGQGPQFVPRLCFNVGATDSETAGIVRALARCAVSPVRIYFETCVIGGDQSKLEALRDQLLDLGKASSISAHTRDISWSVRPPHAPIDQNGGRVITVDTSSAPAVTGVGIPLTDAGIPRTGARTSARP